MQLSRGPYDLVTEKLWQRRGRQVEPDPAAELRRILPAVLSTHPAAMASHLTAGILHGLRLPRRAERLWPLHLTSSEPSQHLRGANITGHRAMSLPGSPVLAAGLRCTGPARTVVDIASLRAGRRPLLTCAPSVDSPLETRVGLCLERSGLTGWVTDLQIRAPGGGSIWPDLVDPVHRLSIQVEGAVHDLRNQRVRDIRRERITEAACQDHSATTRRRAAPGSSGGSRREGSGPGASGAGRDQVLAHQVVAGHHARGPIQLPQLVQRPHAHVAEAGGADQPGELLDPARLRKRQRLAHSVVVVLPEPRRGVRLDPVREPQPVDDGQQPAGTQGAPPGPQGLARSTRSVCSQRARQTVRSASSRCPRCW